MTDRIELAAGAGCLGMAVLLYLAFVAAVVLVIVAVLKLVGVI